MIHFPPPQLVAAAMWCVRGPLSWGGTRRIYRSDFWRCHAMSRDFSRFLATFGDLARAARPLVGCETKRKNALITQSAKRHLASRAYSCTYSWSPFARVRLWRKLRSYAILLDAIMAMLRDTSRTHANFVDPARRTIHTRPLTR